jgi:hypothetical protein
MIDLQPFCSTNPTRRNLGRPWSLGVHTYASNGAIMVRVPRRHDIPPNAEAPDPVKLFDKAGAPTIRPLPKLQLPQPDQEECEACKGRGYEHDCPDCQCECAECKGTGIVTEEISVNLGGAIFDTKYIKMLQDLPNCRIAIDFSPDWGMFFTFDGGDGLLMTMRYPHRRHIKDAETA